MNKFAHLDIQQIHDLNGMAVLAIDADGIITYANTAANDLLHRKHAQPVGQSLFLFFGGGTPGKTYKKELLAGKPACNIELVFQDPLGEERWLLLSSQVIVDMNGLPQTYLFVQDISALKKKESIPDDSGQIVGASKIARDLSRQQEFEEKMQRYIGNVEILNTMGKLVSESLDIEEILQRVIDASAKIVGAAFGVFFYNRLNEHGASDTLFTYSGGPPEAIEKVGMSHNSDFFSPAFSLEENVRSADITKDPRYECYSSHHVMAKFQLPLVSCLAVPVISKSGYVIGRLLYGHPETGRFTEEHEKLIVGIATQASVALENAELYEEIRYLNAKKDEFIGLASHELKTPITSLMGFLQIISKRMIDQDINKPFVDKALNQTIKLSALVGDLLDVTKIESGQLPLSYSSFDLVVLVRDLIEQTQYSFRSHYIAFYSEKASFTISGDKERLEQVIINLLNNAIKYSPGADLINVSLSGDACQAIVRIQDFGMGIAPEQQERIFSRFYRAEGVDAHISGLGIGLYISNEIISRHKGRLTVESRIGKGSVFVVKIPV
ncbi:ATP-binding protein [Parapedobacter sp. GCM10030251]|uniref:ATP-binding protein n=1 Tax=Parapedobacter sp. GCM10030251 TaxID=3273419 RepID=UPI00360ECA55